MSDSHRHEPFRKLLEEAAPKKKSKRDARKKKARKKKRAVGKQNSESSMLKEKNAQKENSKPNVQSRNLRRGKESSQRSRGESELPRVREKTATESPLLEVDADDDELTTQKFYRPHRSLKATKEINFNAETKEHIYKTVEPLREKEKQEVSRRTESNLKLDKRDNEDPFMREESGPHPYKGMVRTPDDDDPTLRLSAITRIPKLPLADSLSLKVADDPFSQVADLFDEVDEGSGQALPVAVGTPTCHWRVDGTGRPAMIGIEVSPGTPLLSLSDFARHHLVTNESQGIAAAIDEVLGDSLTSFGVLPETQREDEPTGDYALDSDDITGPPDEAPVVEQRGAELKNLPSDECLVASVVFGGSSLQLPLKESMAHLSQLTSQQPEIERRGSGFSVTEMTAQRPLKVERSKNASAQVRRAHDLYLRALEKIDEGKENEALVNLKLATVYDAETLGYYQWATWLTFSMSSQRSS